MPVHHTIEAGTSLSASPTGLVLLPWLGRVRQRSPLSIGAALTLADRGIVLARASVRGLAENERAPGLESVEQSLVVNVIPSTTPANSITDTEEVAHELQHVDMTVVEGLEDSVMETISQLTMSRSSTQTTPRHRRQFPPKFKQQLRLDTLVQSPDIPRCDSPIDDYHFNSLSTSNPLIALTNEQLELVAPSANKEADRKLLFIGSDYSCDGRRVYGSICSTITLESPTSDRVRIGETFESHGYSIQSLVNDSFTREQALDRVVSFLNAARPGDVRVIVFSGHAEEQGPGGWPALVPPNCPSRDRVIPAAVWEQSIRDNTKPGVVVLSIFANCFAGGFMQQPIDLKDLNATADLNHNANNLTPIFITFSSCAHNQRGFESSIENKDPYRRADHFLYALERTAHSRGVLEWNGFIKLTESHFQRVRSIGASFDPPCTSEQWKAQNPQIPTFSASEVVVSTAYAQFADPTASELLEGF